MGDATCGEGPARTSLPCVGSGSGTLRDRNPRARRREIGSDRRRNPRTSAGQLSLCGLPRTPHPCNCATAIRRCCELMLRENEWNGIAGGERVIPALQHRTGPLAGESERVVVMALSPHPRAKGLKSTLREWLGPNIIRGLPHPYRRTQVPTSPMQNRSGRVPTA